MATAATLPRTKDVAYTEDTVRFPEEMRFVFAPNNDMGSTFERDALILYPYIARAQISTGKAASILGVHRWDLIEWYALQGLPTLALSVEDVENDVKNLEKLGVA